jgi:uncharacterized protein
LNLHAALREPHRDHPRQEGQPVNQAALPGRGWRRWRRAGPARPSAPQHAENVTPRPPETQMRDDMLTTILNDLNGSSVDIEASAVISADGLMMASLLPPALEADRMGAMSAAMLALGSRTAEELARGALEQVLIKGENGFVLLTQAGNEAVLAVVTRASAKLGLIFLDVRRAAEKIAKFL